MDASHPRMLMEVWLQTRSALTSEHRLRVNSAELIGALRLRETSRANSCSIAAQLTALFAEGGGSPNET